MTNYIRLHKLLFFIFILSVSANKLTAQAISFETAGNACFAGEVIKFINTSPAEFAEATFIWSFENEHNLFPVYSSNNKSDTVVSGITNIKHKFNNPGQYKIVLKLQNDNLIYSKLITVLPKKTSLHQKTDNENNLVNNGDFENYSAIPTKPGEIYLSTDWYSISGSAADFFHRQFDTSMIYNFSMQIPHNFAGFSETSTGGNAYAGIITHVGEINYPDSNNYFNFKGYLFQELHKPMEQGKKYVVQFYCKLSSKSTYTTNIGMCIANAPALNSPQLYNITPQLNTSDILQDTSSWHLVTDTIVANGGEKYLYIGNFNNTIPAQMLFPDNYISSNYGGFKAKVSYFYIDNVRVELIFNEKSERMTLAATGGSYSDNEYSFEYSIGQCFNTTLSDNAETSYLTQGILQPYNFSEGGKSEKNNKTMEVYLSPNPTTELININVSDCKNEFIYIDIIDMNNKTFFKLEKYYCTDKECSFKVNLKQLQSSVYMIRVHNGGEKMKTIKVIKI